MFILRIALICFLVTSCSSHQAKKHQNFEERINAQTAESLNQVESNLNDLLNAHQELTDAQVEQISQRVQLFMTTQKSLREREQKLLELGLGDAIYSSEASKQQWKKEVKKLYEQKAENVQQTVSEIHDITRDPPVKKDFFHEFPFLLREVR
jgi:hypothetical protein